MKKSTIFKLLAWGAASLCGLYFCLKGEGEKERQKMKERDLNELKEISKELVGKKKELEGLRDDRLAFIRGERKEFGGEDLEFYQGAIASTLREVNDNLELYRHLSKKYPEVEKEDLDQYKDLINIFQN
jgi:DNA-binding transcriptional regulator GbsR (MarR family)